VDNKGSDKEGAMGDNKNGDKNNKDSEKDDEKDDKDDKNDDKDRTVSQCCFFNFRQ